MHIKIGTKLKWLSENRSERMDALDENGIFPSERQAFHRARYQFAIPYIYGGNVADIACGVGYGSRMLKQGGANKVTGFDVSLEAICYAKYIHGIEGVSFITADATQLPLPNTHLTHLVSFETIEHVPNTYSLLSEFHRILKTEGLLIISSPNDWGLTEHHYHTWTPFEFMAEVGNFFKIVSVWEQYSDNRKVRGEEISNGSILPWRKSTEKQAECLLIVAKKEI